MPNQQQPNSANELLADYYAEQESGQARSILDLLCAEHAEPIVIGVLRYRLSRMGANALEELPSLRDLVMEQLHRKLRQSKADPADVPIRDLNWYTAAMANNAVRAYSVGESSEWVAFRRRLRYTLRHHQAFDLWQVPKPKYMAAGLFEWSGQSPGTASQLENDCRWELLERAGMQGPPDRAKPSELLFAAFRLTGAPVWFRELVRILAGWVNLQPAANSLTPDERDRIIDRTPSAQVSPEHRAFLLEVLKFSWEEIRVLSPEQRCALLLNPPEQKGVSEGADIRLYVELGIATAGEMANALSLKLEELCKLWNRLPVDDAWIAAKLGCSRQRVINIRAAVLVRLRGRRERWLQKQTGGNIPPP